MGAHTLPPTLGCRSIGSHFWAACARQELGLSKVGWIFSASAQQARDFALSEKEIRAMAALQARLPPRPALAPLL